MTNDQLPRRDHGPAISPCQSPAKSNFFLRVFPSKPRDPISQLHRRDHGCAILSLLWRGLFPSIRSLAKLVAVIVFTPYSRGTDRSLPRCAFWCRIVHYPTPPDKDPPALPLKNAQNEPTAAILAVSDMPVRRIIQSTKRTLRSKRTTPPSRPIPKAAPHKSTACPDRTVASAPAAARAFGGNRFDT